MLESERPEGAPNPEEEERPLPDSGAEGEDSERPDESGASVEEQSAESFPASDSPAW